MKISSLFLVLDDDTTTEPTGIPEVETDASDVLGMSFILSTINFEESYTALQISIAANENIGIVAEVNHTMNAIGVNLELNPTRLIIFGNPNLGTPLMQNKQTTGLDLPQKILVWEDDEDMVHVSYNDPTFIAERHGIMDNTETLETITNALDNISNAAITN